MTSLYLLCRYIVDMPGGRLLRSKPEELPAKHLKRFRDAPAAVVAAATVLDEAARQANAHVTCDGAIYGAGGMAA